MLVALMVGTFLYLESLSFAFGGGAKVFQNMLDLNQLMFLPYMTETSLTSEELLIPWVRGTSWASSDGRRAAWDQSFLSWTVLIAELSPHCEEMRVSFMRDSK